jgi:hypothetical protein
VHTAHALNASSFALERSGRLEPLAALWPGYVAEEDRLAVLLNDPLDAVACANLIVATTILFYEHLREVEGEDGFFRYPDTFLVGVGVQPGEYRKLDVWPPHKVVRVAGDDGPESLLEALTDRRVTLLALPEEGVRCRGPAVLSTWNTLARIVRHVVAYAPGTGQVHEPDLSLVGNPTVESYVDHAIDATEGLSAEARAAARDHRRTLDREPLTPAEAFRVLGGLAAAAPLLGVTEILPAGRFPASSS